MDKMLKPVKKYKIFGDFESVSTVPPLEGLLALQKYKWVPEGGGPENDKVTQYYIKKISFHMMSLEFKLQGVPLFSSVWDESVQIATALNAPFI